jgi:AAA15 family ATPase/GTPase
MFKSEIRDSEINQLLEKVAKRSYTQYLNNISITKLRGFDKKEIVFEFPVTALIGPNGGGKTTILGAVALIHKQVKPRRFFSKSGVYDNSMQDWRVEYGIIDKRESSTGIVSRIASYGNYKWSRSAIDREIGVFGISRTVPPSEKIEFSRFASNKFHVAQDRIFKLDKMVADSVTRILGKDVSDYSELKIDQRGEVSFLTGKTENGIEYSEFHFGAGESSVIRMITSIERMKDNSIIVIEEIENGLHPIATIRMVEYLIGVAERKRIQSVFTTHSNEALLPLPSKAIWVAANGGLYQGKLDIGSLRAITGQVESQLAIFVEDIFAKEWIENTIRYHGLEHFELIEVHGLEGDGMAVTINKNHNADPSVSKKSICIIDGDSQQEESVEDRVIRLPGSSPEAYIFDRVLDVIETVKGELSVSLHLKYEKQDEVARIVKEIRRSNIDEHLLYSQVGQRLGFISENIVRNAFISIWQKHYEAESKVIFEKIMRYLDSEAT